MERNPKLLYQIVNGRARVKPGVFPVQTTSGWTDSAQETADALATFYAQVFTPKELAPTSELPTSMVVDVLDDVTITPGLVEWHLQRLNTRKSPGADGITPGILKACHRQLCQPISILLNHSLSDGRVPVDWKSGIISPIYKGGCRSDVASYRPVTLLPVVSKVMERIITNQLLNHLEDRNLLSATQHGFRKNRSCLSNLLTTLDDWTKALDEGYCVHACYLDISKAFDRVDHDLLLKKLQGYGITGNLLTCLRDYLADRHVRVRVDGALSRWIDVTSGVPQGSVLGPILFLIYMNDLPELVVCRMVMFADDIKIWMRITSVEDCYLLQKDLSTLYDWSVVNKLPFNLQKSKMLQLGRKFAFTYHLGCHELTWTLAEKDLGIWVCGGLKNSMHCQSVYKRAAGVLGILKRIFGRFTPTTLPRILNTYIRPTMEYAVQAWSPWLRKDVALLDRIYHRATKLVAGYQNLTYETRLTKLNVWDFTQRRLRADLILMYNILNCHTHPLSHMFQRAPHRITRSHSETVVIPRSRLDCRRHFYSVRVSFIWNALPGDVVNAASREVFKYKLDTYMYQNTLQKTY